MVSFLRSWHRKTGHMSTCTRLMLASQDVHLVLMGRVLCSLSWTPGVDAWLIIAGRHGVDQMGEIELPVWVWRADGVCGWM